MANNGVLISTLPTNCTDVTITSQWEEQHTSDSTGSDNEKNAFMATDSYSTDAQPTKEYRKKCARDFWDSCQVHTAESSDAGMYRVEMNPSKSGSTSCSAKEADS